MSKSDLHGQISRLSKFDLHGQISRWNLDFEFRQIRIWIHFEYGSNSSELEFLSSKYVLHGHISKFTRIKPTRKIRGSNFRVEMYPTRVHFGFKNKAEALFLKACWGSHSEFQSFETLMNWSRIGTTMVLNFANFAQLSDLSKFRSDRNFDLEFETECHKGKLTSSGFKNFWPHYV